MKHFASVYHKLSIKALRIGLNYSLEQVDPTMVYEKEPLPRHFLKRFQYTMYRAP